MQASRRIRPRLDQIPWRPPIRMRVSRRIPPPPVRIRVPPLANRLPARRLVRTRATQPGRTIRLPAQAMRMRHCNQSREAGQMSRPTGHRVVEHQVHAVAPFPRIIRQKSWPRRRFRITHLRHPRASRPLSQSISQPNLFRPLLYQCHRLRAAMFCQMRHRAIRLALEERLNRPVRPVALLEGLAR